MLILERNESYKNNFLQKRQEENNFLQKRREEIDFVMNFYVSQLILKTKIYSILCQWYQPWGKILPDHSLNHNPTILYFIIYFKTIYTHN